jgi:hypothetical protein
VVNWRWLWRLDAKLGFEAVNGVMETEAGPVVGPPDTDVGAARARLLVDAVGLWENASVRGKRGRRIGDWCVVSGEEGQEDRGNGIVADSSGLRTRIAWQAHKNVLCRKTFFPDYAEA